jgi:hypothetical protein
LGEWKGQQLPIDRVEVVRAREGSKEWLCV